jgi:hypothetical protein
MKKHGVSENDLKPAHLMLSSCERDLGKQTENSNPAASRVHFDNSINWLQKVYGSPAKEPASSTRNALGLDLSDTNRPPTTAQTQADTHRNCNPGRTTKAIPDRPRNDRPPSCSSITTTDSNMTLKETSSSAQVHVLEREIEYLRDQQASQAQRLSEARSAKRNLEADLASERSVRRRLERTLDNVEKELKWTKKMEAFALQKVDVEAGARRRAESLIEEEREKRRDVEKALETSKPCYEDFAYLFQRGAQNDGKVFMGPNGSGKAF